MRTFLFTTFRNISLPSRLVILAVIVVLPLMLLGFAVQLGTHHFTDKQATQENISRAWAVSHRHLSLFGQLHQRLPNEGELKDISELLQLHTLALSTEDGNAIRYISTEDIDAIDQLTEQSGEIELAGKTFQLSVGVNHKLFDGLHGLQAFSNLLVTFVLLIAVGASMLYSFNKAVLRHLITLATYARHMSANTLSEPLRLKRSKYRNTHDELDQVVESIEHMRSQLIDDLDQRRAIELALIAEKEEKIETRKMIQEAKASDRAKSQFIATMSHEIRTPMNGVIGMVEMLRGTELDKEQIHYLEVIARSSESLMSIINDILDYSKIEAGKMSLERIEFSLEDIVDDCIQLFAGTAVKKNVELVSSITPDTPTKLYGDPTRIKQILINLIGNAFKFTARGFVYVEVYAITNYDDPNPTIHFSVNDSGIGIDSHAQTAVFDAFRQADSTTTRKYGGTGLGLAICKQLIELMDGRIGVSSEQGKGSSFWFTCPLSRLITDETDTPSCSLAMSAKTLLLVHPYTYLDHAMLAHCKSINLNLICRRTYEEVIELVEEQEQSIDFMVVNQDLGNHNGLELANSLRDYDEYFEMPIMMLSNEKTSSFSLDQLMAVSSVVTRPIALQSLFESLMSEGSGISLSELVPTKVNDSPAAVELNVLVAEDNVVNRMVIEGLLNKLKISPDFSENGVEVVKQYSSLEKQYDLILMDCEMPEMDGFEATLKIRRWESDRGQPHVPIIALTAHVEAEHRQRVFDVGMNFYVSKPVTLEKINEALSSVGLT
ncbi:MAG: signal transduction histidine kinase/CheY-like chemotaxis protein [Flavobacteriales bacterium]|jgi:signal transduction histidine kinase/CheY-like chemotaxis protein